MGNTEIGTRNNYEFVVQNRAEQKKKEILYTKKGKFYAPKNNKITITVQVRNQEMQDFGITFLKFKQQMGLGFKAIMIQIRRPISLSFKSLKEKLQLNDEYPVNIVTYNI